MPRCSARSETRLTDGFSAIAVHKFVDVKTKKSKEVRVRSSEIREPQSRDRFRRFVFSFFFSSCPAPSNKNSKKKEERAHRRGPKRTVERTNGDNSSFPRIAIKSTTRLSVSFFSFIFHDNRVARRSRTTTVTERTIEGRERTEARDEIETEETANSRPLQRDGTERQRHLVVTKKANTRDLTRRRHLLQRHHHAHRHHLPLIMLSHWFSIRLILGRRQADCRCLVRYPLYPTVS